MLSRNGVIGISVMIFIIAVWALAWPISQELPSGSFREPVGSVYNGLNVLFTALAFGGVIITLLFQSEQARHARREEIERSIFDLFQTFSSQEFQSVKNGAYRVLIAAVVHDGYARFLASRLFAVDQDQFPSDIIPVLRSLDYAKEKNAEGVTEYSDRADRLMLDNMINFFALLAQRESSKEVIKHCDFAYDWWRPLLWNIALFQQEHHKHSEDVEKYCRTRLVSETLTALDKMYGHGMLGDAQEIRNYINSHPLVVRFRTEHALPAPQK